MLKYILLLRVYCIIELYISQSSKANYIYMHYIHTHTYCRGLKNVNHDFLV
ncbi:hypothetical protein AAHE18_02G151600 [Arachis hypogaea]